MKFAGLEDITSPYRIGWKTATRFGKRDSLGRRRWALWHRPWQSESPDVCRFARRAVTAKGARRKMEHDASVFLRRNHQSLYQRIRTRLARRTDPVEETEE